MNVGTVALALLLLGPPGAAAQDGLPCPGEPTDMAISYGQSITCQINVRGDTDTFRFAGAAGDVIVIQAAVGLASAVFPCFELAAPDGSRTGACVNLAFSNRLDAVLTQSGTYTIVVRDGLVPVSLSNPGAYDLILERVLPASLTARDLPYGQVLNDQIDIRGDLDLFTFSGTAGSTVAINMVGGGNNGVRACLELVAPNNARSQACLSQPANRLQAGLTQTGIYTVIARDGSVSVNAGPYTIELQCVSGCGGPQPPSLPAPPTGFGSTPVAPQGIRLFWTASPTATSYRLVVAGPGLSFDQNIGNTTAVQGVGLPSGSYSAQLFGVNASGQSATPATLGFTIGGCAPPGAVAPPGQNPFTVTKQGGNVTVSWPAAANATQYIFEVVTPGGALLAVFPTPTTTLFASNPPNGSYLVRVFGRNSCGDGPRTSPDVVITIP